MKLFALLFFIMLSNAQAGISYDISINPQGYHLQIEMSFKKEITLSYVRGALKNGEVLAKLSPNVVSVANTELSEGRYKSLMEVKSFGLSSRLASVCMDKNTSSSWTRSCSLQTHELDGGKYMAWKGDEVRCEQKENVVCHFVIKGKALPVKILGLQILSAELFSVKAKFQALANFFKLYIFIEGHNLSVKSALEKYNRSLLKTELDVFEKTGSEAVKKTGFYKHQFSLKDTE